jgi:predicted nucleotidyltransferase
MCWRGIERRWGVNESQASAIRDWARKAQYVSEVRVFGSRARNHGRIDSDVDIAITIGGADAATIRGHYFAEGPRWQKQLSEATGLRVHVGLYDDPDGDVVRASCNQCSIIMFRCEP